MDILRQLNARQRVAATHGDGPVAVIAGPGTGKTLTLTARIAYLIGKKHVPANRIVVLTFTRKAAQEIKERLRSNKIKAPWVGTFHQLGNYMTDLDDEQLPTTKQSVISEGERLAVIKDITNLKAFALKEISMLISHFKQQEWLDRHTEIAQLIHAYNQFLQEHGYCDYDDMLINVYHRLEQRRDTDVKRGPYHVLVDEFQDTNPLQYKICTTLGGYHNNLFVIGDPLQSIYSFQGASPLVFENFARDFPTQTLIQLAINYRSTRNIVGVATSFFPKNASYVPATEEEGEVVIVSTLDIYAEARWIIQKIQQMIGGTDLLQSGTMNHLNDRPAIMFKSFAVLYRTHHTGRAVEKTLQQSGMPYQKIGEESFFQERAMQYLINMVKYVTTGEKKYIEHEQALKKIEGPFTLRKLLDLSIKLYRISEEHQAMMQSILHHYFSMPNGINAFLAYIDKLERQEFYDNTADKVTLTTMHGSKGLEFDYVFLYGFDPFISKHRGYATHIEEEKRLLYVAITRAKKKLFVLNSTSSPFKKLFHTSYSTHIVDQKFEKDKKRKEKYALKKAQQKLF